jgi:hypothetical protein
MPEVMEVEKDGLGAALERVLGAVDRRRFLKGAGMTVGLAGVAGMATGCGGVFGVDPSSGPAPSLADVLNFALNLEYLEANFYSYIVNGTGIPASAQGSSPGTVTGGAKISFSDPNVAALAAELAADELSHVVLLRAALIANNITPVDQPALNLAPLGPIITNDATFLAAARSLETVGTSAYEGGIQYLVASADIITYAALIHDTEAQHEGVLRQFCISKGVQSPAVDKYDRPPVLGPTGIFNTSNITGFNTARNASEVLQIVYLAPGQIGVSHGGFFPNGLNGNVKTT